MCNIPATPVQRRRLKPFYPAHVVLLLFILSLAYFSNAHATRLYLTPDGYLEEIPKARSVVKMPLRLNSPREWRKILTGGMGSGSFGFNIYAQNFSRADAAASVEIVLEAGGEEVTLASWPKGLGVSRGTDLFTGSQGGSGVQAKAGDVIVLRVTAQKTGTYHGYGSLYMGGQFSSSIDVPDLTALNEPDIAMLDTQFSSVYDDLAEIRRQQEVVQAQLSLISESLANIEGLLAAYLPPSASISEEEPAPAIPKTPERTKIYSMRFEPQVLTLPLESGLALVCTVELDSPEEVAATDRNSLELAFSHSSIKPNPEYCLDQTPEPASSSMLKVCFSAEEVAASFDGGEPETLIFTAWLKGSRMDQSPLVARGILRVVRKAQDSAPE
ncbi:MAG: hypothetical protein HY788_01565 [Deltaproteobacteria bacterium]|nr:hypothetical protein [Deltaproteobacteria bacterium]